MKVLLIDIDSRIPNLALMQLSAYHKSRGDEVGFGIPDPDMVYASIIYSKDRHMADGLRFMYPDAEIDIGGSGYDIRKRMPEIESLKPDCSLYPDCTYSLGFSTRGCCRHCPFCIVPEKEGAFRIACHPSTWYDPSKAEIVFLDNNILTDKSHFLGICDWVISKNLKVDFNQGLDIRLMDLEIAEKLTQLKPRNVFKFAYDSAGYRASVSRGIEMLKRAGFDLRNRSHFYVYCNGDEDYADAVARCREIKAWGSVPYVMVNPEGKITRRVRDLRRWGTRSWITMSCDIEDYGKVRI